MFILSSISMFKSNRWKHIFLTYSASLPLSGHIVGVEDATPVSDNVSLIKFLGLRSLSKLYLSIVSMLMMICFGFLQKI